MNQEDKEVQENNNFLTNKNLVAENRVSTKLTEREKNELAIQQMLNDWPVEDLDDPEKLKTWINKE